jgi:glucosamine--fructose-6-phosphate aminotransferase (isomerizing)
MTTASYTPVVESLGKFPDPFLSEIAGQPDALRRAARSLIDRAKDLDSVAERARAGSVVWTGMGSSYDACYPAIADLGRAGVGTIHVDAAELLHFRAPILGPDTVVVAVSQSGESAEVVQLARELRERAAPPLVVAVTNGVESSLASLADLVLDTRAGVETGPSSMTFAGSLVIVGGLARTIAGMRGRDAATMLSAAAETAAEAIGSLLADPALEGTIERWLSGMRAMVILGRGPGRAASEMGALTIKESAGIAAESLQTAQFRHGPLELAGPELAVAIVATEAETRNLDLSLAQQLVDTGAAVMAITDDGVAPAGVTPIAIGLLDRAVGPAAAIVPLQLAARCLAIRAGREPGTYYRASKVTTRE